MNWKLILQLSLFGLAMGIATVYVIPSTIEPLFWLVIFLVCAVILARNLEHRHFIHGLMVSIVNSIWIMGAHLLLFDSYVSNHPDEAEMLNLFPISPVITMLITGSFIGVISGLILGLFAFIASKIVKK